MSTAPRHCVGSRPLLGAAPAARVLRRPRRHAVPRRGDRRDLAVPARVQREHRRAVLHEPADGALVELAHEKAASLPRLLFGEIAFGPSMTSLTSCSRGASRERCTRRRDRRHRPRPRRATSRRGSRSRMTSGSSCAFADLTDDLELDYDDLESQLSERTRVVGVPRRGELRRHGARREARSSTSRTPSARSRGPTRSTTGRTARSTSRTGTSTS